MKDYATETDIITTPDPLFHHGDRVKWLSYQSTLSVNSTVGLIVESTAWSVQEQSWTYTLVYFLSENEKFDQRWDGSLAEEAALEKDLQLVSRAQNTSKYTIINGKQVIFKK